MKRGPQGTGPQTGWSTQRWGGPASNLMLIILLHRPQGKVEKGDAQPRVLQRWQIVSATLKGGERSEKVVAEVGGGGTGVSRWSSEQPGGPGRGGKERGWGTSELHLAPAQNGAEGHMPLTLALVPHHVRTQGGGERWTSTATWLLVAAHGMGSRPPLLPTSWGPVWTRTLSLQASPWLPSSPPCTRPPLLRATGLHFSFPRRHFPTTAHPPAKPNLPEPA